MEIQRTMEGAKEDADVIYCVTAILDLQGFSSHLESGFNDIRTNIGKQAITRLNILEKAINLIESEKTQSSQYCPANLRIQRINDAIIMGTDLPDFLKPSVGNIKKGFSAIELLEWFPTETEETFDAAYKSKIKESIANLMKFMGLVSRTHAFINRRESEEFFPGAKTTVSTGFRKQFYTANQREDYFSANFSLANAHIAKKTLKGSVMYVDNYIFQLLANNGFALNLIRYAMFIVKERPFDPFENYEDLFFIPSHHYLSEAIEIEILRRRYFFNQISANPLACLQILEAIEPYLNGNKLSKGTGVFITLIDRIKKGMSPEMIKERKYKDGIFVRMDLEENVSVLPDIITNGFSALRRHAGEAVDFKIQQSLDTKLPRDRPGSGRY